jgi:hypothetical protein
MKEFVMKKILTKLVLISLTLIPVNSFASDVTFLTATTSCSEIENIKRKKVKPQWKKPLNFYNTDYSKDSNGSLIFKSELPKAVAKFVITPGNGKYVFSGSWLVRDRNLERKFTSASIPSNSIFPITINSSLLLGVGNRECSITIDTAGERNVSISSFFDYKQKEGSENKIAIQNNKESITSNKKNIQYVDSKANSNASSIKENERTIQYVDSKANSNTNLIKKRTTTLQEGYSQNKTGTANGWATYKSAVPFQQNQFCRLVENFRDEIESARNSRNQIKENMAYKNRELRLNALLPNGNFSNWIVRSLSVMQALDGSAAVLFEMPCDVVVGSYACGNNKNEFIGTIAENSMQYTELAQINVGDFIGVSGSFDFGKDATAFDGKRSVASYKNMPIGSHCKGSSMGLKGSEFFAVKTDFLSVLK